MTKRNSFYLLVVYIPEDAADTVKSALFEAGAGRIGNYDSCAWQTLGNGQFRALDGANPTIGAVGAVEQVPELRVEMVCAKENLDAVEQALHSAHPYETPAYHFVLVESA